MTILELIRDERPDALIGSLPNTPTPALYVIRLREWASDDEGRPLLTKRCTSLLELDTEIDAIKERLDQIQKEAHQRWGAGSAESLR